MSIVNIEKEIRFFLRSKMYSNKKVLIKNNNHGKKIIIKIFFILSIIRPSKFLS